MCIPCPMCIGAIVATATSAAVVVKKIKSKAKIDPKRIIQIDSKVKHDIIAFLTSIHDTILHTNFIHF